MSEKGKSFKSAVLGFGSAILMLIIGGFIGTTQKGCTSGTFDAFAQTSNFIPKCADSTARVIVKPIKKQVKKVRLGQLKLENLYEASLQQDQYEAGMAAYRRDSAKFEIEYEEE